MDLYEDRKIVQHGSAVNLMDGLVAQDNKKGVERADKAIAKAKGTERVSKKQQEALKKAGECKKEARAGRTWIKRIIEENTG